MNETDSPEDEVASESDGDVGPFMHVDYRVFEVSVHGGAGDSVEDVNEVMEGRLMDALNQIEALKRTDFELDDEFDVDRSGGAPRRMHN